MLFEETPKLRRRSPAFAISSLIHAAGFAVLLLWQAATIHARKPLAAESYSIRILQLRSSSSPARSPVMDARASYPAPHSVSAANAAPAPSGSTKTLSRDQFDIASTRHQPANQTAATQTIVQPDLPPSVLEHDIPLPPLLIWTQTAPKFPAKQFVAPPLKEIAKPSTSAPVLPKLELRNIEPQISDLKIASASLPQAPHLPRPPATTSPVVVNSPNNQNQLQNVLPDLPARSLNNIISIPADDATAKTAVVLPPANQIASKSTAGSGPEPGAGQQNGANRTDQPSSGGKSSASQTSNGANETAAGKTASSGGEGTVASSERGGAPNAQNNIASGTAPELTFIHLPKDGKFGVLVMGSAAASPFPDAAGSLKGSVIYTVYVDVGARKKWILQYCSSRSDDNGQSAPGSAAPLEAPWPFVIARPEHMIANYSGYVLVHGTLTVDGRLDQLSLVSPENIQVKDLLFPALSKWAFRPATQSGKPVIVEILLVIPLTSE